MNRIILGPKKSIFFTIYILFFIFLTSVENYSQTEKQKYPEIKYSSEVLIDTDYTFENLYLNFPTVIRISPSDEIVVLDGGEDCLYFFSMEGKYVRKIGGRGQGPGELLLPTYFNIDNEGDIYVYDEGNHRISIFSKEGKFINSFRIQHRLFAFSVTENQEIVANLNGEEYYITVYSRNGDVIRKIGKVVKYLDHPGFNSMFAEGFPFFVGNKQYYLFFSYTPLLKIFDEKGELIKDVNIELPEVIDRMKTTNAPKPGDKDFGLHWVKFYSGIIFKNNYFYIMPIFRDKESYHTDIYKIDLQLEVLKKMIPPPEKLTSTPRTGRRFKICFSAFDISNDENYIYNPVPEESMVLMYLIQK